MSHITWILKTTAKYQENKEKIKRCISVLNWYKQNNYYIVYVDEFSVNRNITSIMDNEGNEFHVGTS